MFACLPMAMCFFGRVENFNIKNWFFTNSATLDRVEESFCMWNVIILLLAAVSDDDEWLHLQPSALHCALGCWRHKREKSFVEAIDCQLKNLKCKEWASEWAIVEWWCDIDDHQIWLRYFNSKFSFSDHYTKENHILNFSPILDFFTLHCRSKVKRITFFSSSPFASSHKWDYRSMKSRAEWSEWTTQDCLIKIHTHELVMRIIPGGFIFFLESFQENWI